MARKRVTIKETVEKPSVEVVDETTPETNIEETLESNETLESVDEVVEVSIDEVIEPKKTEKQEESSSVVKTEETTEVIPKVKRRKKMSPDKIVDEAIKKNNLPVYDEENVLVETLKFEKDKKRTKPSKKQIAYQKRQHEILVEKKILDGDNAAYVQLVKEKKRTKKIIRYNTDLNNGLSSEIVEHRKLQNLANTKNVGSTKTIPTIIISNIFTFFNFLNFAIAAWIISVKSWGAWKYIFFIIIVTANMVISIVQEIRSKMVIDKLSILSAPNAVILRDGDMYDISVTEVVLDDILCLSSGNQIASDSILIEGGIEVNESLLTGESDAISKKPGDILYAGSFVVSGNCKARVERVGKDNYIEKLTSQAKKYRKPKSELLKTLKDLIRVVAVIIIPLGSQMSLLV